MWPLDAAQQHCRVRVTSGCFHRPARQRTVTVRPFKSYPVRCRCAGTPALGQRTQTARGKKSAGGGRSKFPGATVNDVFAALMTMTVRKYLEGQGDPAAVGHMRMRAAFTLNARPEVRPRAPYGPAGKGWQSRGTDRSGSAEKGEEREGRLTASAVNRSPESTLTLMMPATRISLGRDAAVPATGRPEWGGRGAVQQSAARRRCI